MLQLHYFPGNASMTPHILLEEPRLAFELKFVDRAAMQRAIATQKLAPPYF